jgi:hypothetical protein
MDGKQARSRVLLPLSPQQPGCYPTQLEHRLIDAPSQAIVVYFSEDRHTEYRVGNGERAGEQGLVSKWRTKVEHMPFTPYDLSIVSVRRSHG